MSKPARISSGERDRLLGWMPIVIRDRDLSDWERSFCASIIAKANRGTWWPSQKQAAVMQRLVSAFLDRNRDEPVIDGDRN